MVAEILRDEAAGREACHRDAGFPAVLRVGEEENGFLSEAAHAVRVHAQGGIIHVFQQGGFKKLPVYGVEVDAGSGGYQHQQEGCKEAAEKRAVMRLPCRVPVIRHVLSSPAYCIFR